MNVDKNAPLTPKAREAIVRSPVEGGLSKADAVDQFNTTSKTVDKWVKRFRAEGVAGLRGRSSSSFAAADSAEGRHEIDTAQSRFGNGKRGKLDAAVKVPRHPYRTCDFRGIDDTVSRAVSREPVEIEGREL